MKSFLPRAPLGRRVAAKLVRCSVLSGAYAAADSCSWQGANRSDAQWHREDLQRGHGREGAAHKCRLALNTALTAYAPHAAAAAAIVTAAVFSPVAAAADMNAVNNAAKIASGVGAGTAVPSVGVGAVLQTLVGLAVVVALVFACAWLARRFGLQPSARGHLVRTIGGVSLGGKERVAVVQIGDTWLVVGAAPGNVRLLHTMPAPGAGEAGLPSGGRDADPAAMPGGPLPGTFGSRFRAALADEARKRFSRPSGGGK